MALTAKDIMTPSVKAVPQSWTTQQLSRFLTANGIAGSPVADAHGAIVGIVTLKDLAELHWNKASPDLKSLTPEERAEVRRLRRLIFQEMSRTPAEVRDIMTPNAIAVSPETPVVDIATIMMEEHLHRIFVTETLPHPSPEAGDNAAEMKMSRNEIKEVVGIITTYDMLRVIAEPDLARSCLDR